MVAGLTSSLLSLLLPVIVLAGPHGSPLLNRHHDLARREISHTGARFTYYVSYGALGSCGQHVFNANWTVALNAVEMNPSLCFAPITITYNGKSAQAQIVDTCPGCPSGGLDLTQDLFAYFADTRIGVILGDWKTETATAPSAPPPPAPSPPHGTEIRLVTTTASSLPHSCV